MRLFHIFVVLDGEALPEGAAASVVYLAPIGSMPATAKRRIQVPLVPTNQPVSVHLTGERIAEILDEEDVTSRRQYQNLTCAILA